jgi:xanthine dehydrogenase YagR molybdenum-binding subunit
LLDRSGHGALLHRNYSGYLVPTKAHIPELGVILAGEFDSEASLLGSKGLSRLTPVSVAPAISNTIYHATGKRVHELPVTVEMLLYTRPSRRHADRTQRRANARLSA